MAYLDDLKTARDSAAARLVEVLDKKRPTYSIEGQNVDWTAYAKMLTEEINALNEIIQAAEPFEIHSVGYN